MTVCWAPHGEDWRLARITSREIVAVEKRFDDLSAAKIFTNPKFEIVYRVLWFTLRTRGDIGTDVTLSAFMDGHDLTLNVPVRLLEETDLRELREQGLIDDPDAVDPELGDERPAPAGDGDDSEPAASEPDPT